MSDNNDDAWNMDNDSSSGEIGITNCCWVGNLVTSGRRDRAAI